MSTDKVWADKLAQLFHDPFWKAWCQGQTAKDLALWLGGQLDGDVEQATWERGAQDKVGMLLSQRMLGDQFIFPGKGYLFKDARIIAEQVDAAGTAAAVAPDLAAAGADRPVLGAAHQVRVQLWEPQRSDIIVTHPLCAHPLRVPVPSNLPGLEAKLAPSLTVLDRYRDTIGRLPEAERAQSAVLLAWRLAEDLAAEDGIFWPLQPADTRCPDHSIWDHLRVASALAFIPDSQAADENLAAKNPERRPWLLSVWVGPTRDFLGTARTGRDLWTGSTMLAELAWAMMEPIAEALGPDAMVYPDLRGNLRADRWLHERHPEVLTARPVGSRAALIPNRFTAVVPEAQVEDLAAVARRSVEARWRAMAQRVREHLRAPDRLGPGAWEQVFEAQVETPPITRWVAVPWSWDGRNKDARALKPVDIQLPPIIPFQANPPQVPKAVEEIEAKRRSRFEDWIDPETFHHYQAARWTYLQTHPQYLPASAWVRLSAAPPQAPHRARRPQAAGGRGEGAA